MSTMFRLETPESAPEDRCGPYCNQGRAVYDAWWHSAGVAAEEACDDEIYDRQPRAEDDGLPRCRDSKIFGFESLEAYRQWFPDANGRAGMGSEGVIGVYEVPEDFILFGGHQCVADGKHMTHLGDIPCDYEPETLDPMDLTNQTGLPKISGDHQWQTLCH